MLNKIKTQIQNRLYQECKQEYDKTLRYQKNPYSAWVSVTEQLEERKNSVVENYPNLSVVYMQQCGKDFSLSDVSKDIILFASQEGRISPHAFRDIVQYFEQHQDTNIVYADEDVWALTDEETGDPYDEITHRICPWIKPIWSPDTLLSFQYFGNLFAIRKKAFENVVWLGKENPQMNIYDFLLKATEMDKEKPGHIEKVLFHRYVKGPDKKSIEEDVMHDRNMPGASTDFDVIKDNALKRRGITGKMEYDKEQGFSYPMFETQKKALVSIIIPSKDNADVLMQCIRSIYRLTDYKDFEIIVIDNGSTAQTRMRLEKFRQECEFVYLYHAMDFNFSAMCNMAVAKSQGEYILLLNDDMEIIQASWLRRMVGQALLPHVGAVGAKLLYPNTTLIQHAGVTNSWHGPGHKLKQLDDEQCYYYGRNKLIYDMIGVTAACLLIKKSLYQELGGLYEGLKVAYNDVDLCFRIHEKGLYNVQRNDVVLYHHESLSRGDDMKDKAKLKRLMEEKDLLYERHPDLCRKDVFTGTIMNGGEPEYACRMMEQYEIIDVTGHYDEVREGRKLPPENRMNHAIMIVVEECGKYNRYYHIKGWAYVPGVDNARYNMKMLFRNAQGKVWEIPVSKIYRKDVAAILPDEKNVGLTGFCCCILEDTLPKDTYEIWLTAKDGCSRQVLYRNTEKKLTID